MSLDDDIATAIAAVIAFPVYTSEFDPLVRTPMVHVDANTEANVQLADLNMSFHKREKDFLVTLRGFKDSDISTLQPIIETAILGMTVVNGWMEITGEMEDENEKIHESLITGKQVWWS